MKMTKKIAALALAAAMSLSALPAWAEGSVSAPEQSAPAQETVTPMGVELEGRWASLEELLASGVITQETHDAIRAYLEAKEPAATATESAGKSGRKATRQDGQKKTGSQSGAQAQAKRTRKSAAPSESADDQQAQAAPDGGADGQQPPEVPNGDMNGQQPPEVPNGDMNGQQPPEMPDGDMGGRTPGRGGPGGQPSGQGRNGRA